MATVFVVVETTKDWDTPYDHRDFVSVSVFSKRENAEEYASSLDTSRTRGEVIECELE